MIPSLALFMLLHAGATVAMRPPGVAVGSGCPCEVWLMNWTWEGPSSDEDR